MKELKTAILGGSFDPVHLGHLFLLHSAVSLTDYRRFIVVPAALSNYKIDSEPVATKTQRYEMLKLALEDFKTLYPSDSDADIRISEVELNRGGVSYTYDTVMGLKNTLGIDGRIGFIIGDDHIRALKGWYRYQDLKKEVEFIICPRENDKGLFSMLDSDLQYIVLDTKTVAPENSTEIRSGTGRGYLSKRVEEYVRKNNLYM